jgi:hypothetical protein
MAADEDAKSDPDAEVEDTDAVSGERAKRSSAGGFEMMLADFRRRTEGLEPHEIDEEVDRFLDKMVERHVMVAPKAMRDSLRETLKTAVASDPIFAKMIAEMRASAQAR